MANWANTVDRQMVIVKCNTGVTITQYNVSLPVMEQAKSNKSPKHRRRQPIMLVALLVLFGCAGAVWFLAVGPVMDNKRFEQGQKNLGVMVMRMEIGFPREEFMENGIDNDAMINILVKGLTNPYTGKPLRYIPFGDEPNHGDVTGFVARVAMVNCPCDACNQFADSAEADLDYGFGAYLYMYGPTGDTGQDVNLDGKPDNVLLAIQTEYQAQRMSYLTMEPLDVVLERMGIPHGLASNHYGDCIWGKPCLAFEGESADGRRRTEDGGCWYCGEHATEAGGTE
jgi:hypothetical protein